MKLKEGEVLCDKCNGTGLEPDRQNRPLRVRCPKCRGVKKVDWISNIIGLKPEVYVEPGVYTKEIDFSEYIRREVNNACIIPRRNL